jgi:hypothetical protein
MGPNAVPVFDLSFPTAIEQGRRFQGRSRPFPPEAVLGPAFMPGWAIDRRGAVSRVHAAPGARGLARRSPVNRADRNAAMQRGTVSCRSPNPA